MKYALNLATRAYVNRRTLYLSYSLLGALLIVILLFNVIRMISLNNEINQNRDNIETIEGNILARTGVEVADYSETNYRNLLANIETANEILQRDNFRWTGFLDQMERVVPRDVRILRVDPNHKERNVKLSGQAKDLKSLKALIDNLIASKNYGHVFLERQASDDKTAIISFGIRLEGAF